jgi:hypothetical protein
MVFMFEYPYRLKGLIIYKSTVAPLSNNSNTYRSINLVNEHIKKGNTTTSEIINNVLINQKVSISQKELDKLLNLSKVKFYLPFFQKKKTYPALLALVGKPKSKRSNAGIYIYIYSYGY